ncbi:MAG: flagellar motor stator protein MotA [bacterium]|nr:flagellar motor stator protein MotA [bacterium]
MFFIIGVVLILGVVMGGFALSGGNISILIQPIEVGMVFGIALGASLIANPPKVVFGSFKALIAAVKSKGYTKKDYAEVLILLYQLVSKIKRNGPLSVEADVNSPTNSEIFKKYGSNFLKNHHFVTFLCDNLKVIVSGSITANDLETLMDNEIEAFHEESMLISHSVARTSDAMPGLGLVAAVLGVVLTMGKIDQPAEVIGESIAAALLGTFVGILMCYGFIGPFATNLEYKANDDIVYLKIIKTALLALINGASSMMVMEHARRVIPSDNKPTFEELDRMRNPIEKGGAASKPPPK